MARENLTWPWCSKEKEGFPVFNSKGMRKVGACELVEQKTVMSIFPLTPNLQDGGEQKADIQSLHYSQSMKFQCPPTFDTLGLL